MNHSIFKIIPLLCLFLSTLALAQDAETKKRLNAINSDDDADIPADRLRPRKRAEGSSRSGAAVSTDPEHWANHWYSNSLGYEGASSSATSYGMFGQNSISYGLWFDSIGADILIGFAKTANTHKEVVTTSTNPLAQTQTVATVLSGIKSPFIFSLGLFPKYRVYQSTWLQIHGGILLAAIYSTSYDYQTGSLSISTPNTTLPENKIATETALGTVEVDNAFTFAVGPRVGSEVYLKWFPQVAIGFGAGLIAMFNGDAVVTTSTRTATYAIMNGVAQSPSAETFSNVEDTTRPAVSGSTVAIGGQIFSFTGYFTIKYMW